MPENLTGNPYKTPDASGGSAKSRLKSCLVAIGIVVAILLALIGLLLPNVRYAPEAARRMACSNNLRQLGLALLEYERVYHEFPPAYTVDTNGKRLHSWRTLILPYMGGGSLYDQLDLSKPWDDPANDTVRLAKANDYDCLSDFICPSTKLPPGFTTYLTIITPNSCLQPNKGRKLSEITDGVENTVIVYEALSSSLAVHWMSPEDANLDKLFSSDPKYRTAHPGGGYLLFCDAHVNFLMHMNNNEYKSQLEALVTINGGESLSTLSNER